MSEGKGLYIYSTTEISRLLKETGYPDFWEHSDINISRNSDGTALRFLSRHKKKLVIITCDGSISEKDISVYPAWFNDDHQLVAWHDWNTGMVHYKNGMKEKISLSFNPGSGPDPSGCYFIKYPTPSHDTPLSISCITEIFTTDKPDLPLANARVCGIRKIFFKDNKVLVFGNDYSDKEKKIEDSTTAHIFQLIDSKLIEAEEVIINMPKKSPALFYVMDISPWNDEVLFIDVYDFPFRSRLYVFNLRTHEMKKIGKKPFGGGWGFYLQCDIIKEVTEKLKESK